MASRTRMSACRLAGALSPCARTELSSATTGRPSRRASATSGWNQRSGVVELFRLPRHHQLAFARVRIVHGEDPHGLAGEDVERLADSALHHDLMAVFEAQHDVGILGVDVLFAELLWCRRHRVGFGEGRREATARRRAGLEGRPTGPWGGIARRLPTLLSRE